MESEEPRVNFRFAIPHLSQDSSFWKDRVWIAGLTLGVEVTIEGMYYFTKSFSER